MGVQICCFNVSGISSPRHRWIKSRVCPALKMGQSSIEASGVSERGLALGKKAAGKPGLCSWLQGALES